MLLLVVAAQLEQFEAALVDVARLERRDHGLVDPRAFEARTGVPVLVNTSLNTAGRPMVDDPRDALELFGSAPVAALVLGPHLVRRADFVAGGDA